MELLDSAGASPPVPLSMRRCRNWVALAAAGPDAIGEQYKLPPRCSHDSPTLRTPPAPERRNGSGLRVPSGAPPRSTVYPVGVVPGAARLGEGCTRANCRQQSRSPMRGDRLAESKGYYCGREKNSHADGCSVCCPSALGQQVACVETSGVWSPALAPESAHAVMQPKDGSSGVRPSLAGRVQDPPREKILGRPGEFPFGAQAGQVPTERQAR